MHRWLIRTVQVGALALGGIALSGTAAQADWNTGPNAGFMTGNQHSTSIDLPINISGNAIALGGFASAGNGSGDNVVANGRTWSRVKSSSNGNGSGSSNGNGNGSNWNSGPNAGILTGNQSSFRLSAPINISGNAVAIGGFASTR